MLNRCKVPKSKVNLSTSTDLCLPSLSGRNSADGWTLGLGIRNTGGGIYVPHPPPTRDHSILSLTVVKGSSCCINSTFAFILFSFGNSNMSDSEFLYGFFRFIYMNLDKSRSSRWKVNTVLLVDLMVTLKSAVAHSLPTALLCSGRLYTWMLNYITSWRKWSKYKTCWL